MTRFACVRVSSLVKLAVTKRTYTARCATSNAHPPSVSSSGFAMPASAFTDSERRLITELRARGVRFMIVGMSAALIQGARGSTEDINLWFEDPSDPRIAESVRAAGGIWVSGAFGMQPPRIGGDVGERFDVVLTMSGLGTFREEIVNAHEETVDGIALPVLSLQRIAHSKRAAGRAKDKLALESIEDALAVLAAEKNTPSR